MSDESLLSSEADSKPEEDGATQTKAAGDTQPGPEEKTGGDGGKPEPKQEKTDPKADGETKTEPKEYKFEVPRGMPEDFELAPELVEAYTEVVKEVGLEPDAAQKVLDKVVPALRAQELEQQAQLNREWLESTKTDKEIGGERLTETLEAAKAAVKAFGNSALQDLLDGPLGSHPEVIRFLAKVGASVSEDRTFTKGAETKGAASPDDDDAAMARKLYPTSATQ